MMMDYIYLVIMFSDFLNKSLFSLGIFELTPGKIILSSLLIFVLILFRRTVKGKIFPRLKERYAIKVAEWEKLVRILNFFFITLSILLILLVFNIDYTFIQGDQITVRAIYILVAVFVVQVARLIDWFISNLFIKRSIENRDKSQLRNNSGLDPDAAKSATKTGQYFVYILAVIIFLRLLNLDHALFPTTLSDGTTISFNISKILVAILIFLGAKLIIWFVTQLVLYNIYRNNEVEYGAQYAINQLLKYVIYTIAILIALDSLGINMTLVLGGAAALLVGIGLGLQSIFNDFVSGVVLLFERSVTVGDTLKIDDMVGTVKRIGLRASVVEIWDSTTIMVPNHKLVNEQVVNWTHYDDQVRYDVNVGVAYGSDTKRVKEILLEIVKENPYILDSPSPFVRFEEFGDSSLNFTLYFFSKSYRVIEDIKSDIRFEIDNKFRESDINIPFPQLDLWMKNSNT